LGHPRASELENRCPPSRTCACPRARITARLVATIDVPVPPLPEKATTTVALPTGRPDLAPCLPANRTACARHGCVVDGPATPQGRPRPAGECLEEAGPRRRSLIVACAQVSATLAVALVVMRRMRVAGDTDAEVRGKVRRAADRRSARAARHVGLAEPTLPR